MCGIAGLMYRDPARPVEQDLLEAMGRAIAHRGPDGAGFWTGPGVGLAHRRLAIIDLEGGRQPLGNEDGSIQVVFNGEIYNYLSLRDRLIAKGHVFQTRSDTEVLVHLYEEMGPRLVESLRGMFAFAIWDGKKRALLLARDRLGIKPLYYFLDQDKLLFGSELKSILADANVSADLDPAALESYLAFGMTPGSRSIFSRICKLLPGHVLDLRQETWRATPGRYWQLVLNPDHGPGEAEWTEAIREKVAETVKAHLIADVPVGAFLSGGIDSSIVVASCAGATNGPLETFSMGFYEEAFSELPHARRVARAFGTRHTEEIVTPDAVRLIDELSLYYDEPFADPSAVPTFLVSRLASRHVKVALSGDGGDEAFGGYARYAHDLNEAAWRSRLPAWFRHTVLRPLARVWPKADWLPRPLRAKTRLTNLALDPAAAYANTLTLCRQPLRRRLLAPHVAAGLNGHRPEEEIIHSYAAAPPQDALAGMIAADTAVLLPDDFLVKVDRASMANGLEVRPPFLDHELLELAARIPSHFKVREGKTKWIVKEAYRQQLPAEILGRRKQGFELPIDVWLRKPLREMFEDSVLAGNGPVRGLIDPAVVRRLFTAHGRGTGRHGHLLWSILVLARWGERHLGRSRRNVTGERRAIHVEV